MTPEYMSQNTFIEHSADIRAAIRLLMNNDASRERLRVLGLQEEGRTGFIAEVFPSLAFHGMVVVYTPHGRVKRVGKAGVFVRANRRRDDRVLAPLTGDPDQRFWMVGQTHADLSVSGRDVSAWITADVKQVVLNAATPDGRPMSPVQQSVLWLADQVEDIARRPDAGVIYRAVDKSFDDIADALNNE